MVWKILLFMKRKPGMSVAAFRDYYENHHVPLAMANSGGQGGGIATQPVHVGGGINNARDYPTPPGGRQARVGTEVIVRVTVGTDGRASNCSVFRPSPDAEADRITCRLVVERLRFRPATDSAGNPVAAPFYWRQRWFWPARHWRWRP